MRTWTFVAALVALGLVGSPTRSFAQESEQPSGVQASPEQPTGQSQERARALFQAGVAAIEEGDYEGAYRYFRESFELSGRPQLLFNLGNAAERLRRDDEAIDWYRRYLDATPDADNRAYVEGRLRALEQAEASGEPAEPPTDEHIEASTEDTPAPASDGGVVAGWAIVGIGAAIAIAGGILLGVAANERATVDGSPAGAPWPEYEGAHNNANTFAAAGGVLLGVGIAAVIGGVVVAVVSGNRPSGETVAVRISPTGLSLAGRFE